MVVVMAVTVGMAMRSMRAGASRSRRLNGQAHDLAVAHAAFGDDMLAETLHLALVPRNTVTSRQVAWSRWTWSEASEIS